MSAQGPIRRREFRESDLETVLRLIRDTIDVSYSPVYPVGTGSLVGSDILGVFVHPRFQHQGYGKGIMKELEKWAALHAVGEVVLSVSLPSKKFYESLGYEITGSHSMDVGESQRSDYWEGKKKITK